MTDKPYISSVMPDWFGPSMAAAQHQDALSRLPFWQRWLHQKFIAPRCPCCIYFKEKMNG